MAVGWIGRTVLGSVMGWGKGLFSGGSRAAGEAINIAVQGGMSKDLADAKFGGIGKKSLTGTLLKGGAIAAIADIAINRKNGLVGGLANAVWTDIGKIEAEQNTVGRFHGFYKFVQEALKFFNVQGTWLNDWADKGLNTTSGSKSAYTKVVDAVKDSPLTDPTALTAAATLTAAGLVGKKVYDRNTVDGLLNRASVAEQKGQTIKADELLERAAEKDAKKRAGKTVPDTKVTEPVIKAADVDAPAKASVPKTGTAIKAFGKAGIVSALTGVAVVATSDLVQGATLKDAATDGIKSLPFADTVENLSAGENTAAARSAAVTIGGLAGSFKGATAGAAGGAVIGSVVPFVGTTVGGIAGGIAGAIVGGVAGSAVVDKAIDLTTDGLTSVFSSKAPVVSKTSVALPKAGGPVMAPALIEIPSYDAMGNATGMGPMAPKPFSISLGLGGN